MLPILSLFNRSPFAPLQGHMEKVSDCMRELEPLFMLLQQKNYDALAKKASHISELEHAADLLKNDIRNHLPGSLFLSIDRSNFLQILSLQDALADRAEDVAVLLSLHPLQFHPSFQEPFFKFLHKNIEAFEGAKKIIETLGELVESSFGGQKAERVKVMVEAVSFKEHEVDLLQRTLLKSLFAAEKDLTYASFYHWEKVFETTGAISNIAEKLANCIRMTLDVK
jgi:uncharacterized protein